MNLKKKVLVLTGGGYHDFEAGGSIMQSVLTEKAGCQITLTQDRDILTSDALQSHDAIVVYTQGGTLTDAQLKGLLDFIKSGKGFVGIHCANDSFTDRKEYIDMIGGRFHNHGVVCPFEVVPCQSDVFISKRMDPFTITDELYILSHHDPSKVETLFKAYWRGEWHPMGFVKDYGKGKVFYLALGHGPEAFRNLEFQKILIRGLAYVTGIQEKPALRCGIIGYGGAFNMGVQHSKSMERTGRLNTVAVCDLDAARLEVAKKELGEDIQTFTDPSLLIAKANVDLVVVITPHDSHAPIMIEALNAGKHVVVEKPFCITVEEANQIVNAAHKNSVVATVYHNRRWDGDYLAIKNTIDKGLIGDVFEMETAMVGYDGHGTWWRGHKPIAGGAFYDWGAHLVDWSLGIMGNRKMVDITGFFQFDRVWHQFTNEDHCRAVVRFDDGSTLDITRSHISRAPKPRFRIVGTKGGIVDYWGGENNFNLYTSLDGTTVEGKVPYAHGRHECYYRNVADHICLGEELVVTPESARRVIAIIETAEKSAKEGKPLPAPVE